MSDTMQTPYLVLNRQRSTVADNGTGFVYVHSLSLNRRWISIHRRPVMLGVSISWQSDAGLKGRYLAAIVYTSNQGFLALASHFNIFQSQRFV